MAGFGPDCLLLLFLEHNGVSVVTRGMRPRLFSQVTTNNSSCPAIHIPHEMEEKCHAIITMTCSC